MTWMPTNNPWMTPPMNPVMTPPINPADPAPMIPNQGGFMGRFQQAYNNPLFHIGLGILSAKDVGKGGLLGMQSYQSMQANAAQQAYQQQQIENYRMKLEAEQEQRKREQDEAEARNKWMQEQGFAPGTPSWAAQAEYGAKFPKSTEAPSNVREYQFFNSLSPEEQQRYLTMKRANQFLDRGSEFYMPNPVNPMVPAATVPKDVPPEQRPEFKGAQAEATAMGQAKGKSDADAVFGLGQAVEEARNAVSVIDQMMSHPGLDYAVGGSSLLPIVPGTPAADFDALAKQLEGKAFLQAFESLKGGGQITQIEGEKATQAIARLSRAQTEAEYKSSLRELKNIIQRGVARAQSKANRVTNQPSGQFGGFRIVE